MNVRYEVYLIPFLIPDNFTIYGEVFIDIDITETTDNITLHIYDMEIHEEEVEVRLEDGTRVEVAGHSYDQEREFYILQLGEDLHESKARLRLRWTGHLNTELIGLYRSSYTAADGQLSYLAPSKFEPTYARRALPCFDEPAMKAVFQVNLGRVEGMTSLSNMPIKEVGVPIGDTGYVWDVYEDSVKMSTYLLAFVVSDFDQRTSDPLPNGVEFRIWSRDNALSQTAWASEIGPRVLAYYEEYFSIPFPLPKMDMIAIPNFISGAMENWGLITYRESRLLYQARQGPTVINIF